MPRVNRISTDALAIAANPPMVAHRIPLARNNLRIRPRCAARAMRTQTDNDELLAAQNLMLDAIFHTEAQAVQ
jgi:hypothetical protein